MGMVKHVVVNHGGDETEYWLEEGDSITISYGFGKNDYVEISL